jgi:hypothetical protein
MSKRPPMVNHSYKAPRALVTAAHAKADERGENLSDEIRKFLQRYVRRTK